MLLYRHGGSFAAFAHLGPQNSWSSNRISELAGTQYRYDPAGNLIERKSQDGEILTLAYDGAHLQRKDPNGQMLEARYQYDGLSRRILKQVRQNGEETTTWYGWDGDRQCAEATDERLRTTVHEPNSFVPLLRLDQQRPAEDPMVAEVRRLLASEGLQLPEEYRPAIEGLSVACFHTDHLGTPLRLTGEQGQTLWQGQADDWGAIDHEQGETDQPIRFQGQYRDEESGLYYNRYRYYAPELGRYVTQDPIGLMGGLNTYEYVEGDAIRYVDPMGLASQYSLGASGTMAIGILGSGLGISLGVSVPEDWTQWGCYQMFLSSGLNTMAGIGGYLGGGVIATKGNSSGPVESSIGNYRYQEVNGGWGASIGASQQGSEDISNGFFGRFFDAQGWENDKPSSTSMTPLPKVGAGYGVWAGRGYTSSGTYATPTFSNCECK